MLCFLIPVPALLYCIMVEIKTGTKPVLSSFTPWLSRVGLVGSWYFKTIWKFCLFESQGDRGSSLPFTGSLLRHLQWPTQPRFPMWLIGNQLPGSVWVGSWNLELDPGIEPRHLKPDPGIEPRHLDVGHRHINHWVKHLPLQSFYEGPPATLEDVRDLPVIGCNYTCKDS